jgi:hypothetical protein
VCFATSTPFGWVLSIQTAVRATVFGTRQARGNETTIAVGPGFAHRK